MTLDQDWERIVDLTTEYNRKNIGQISNQDKFYIYSIITHSTALEGATLTEKETEMLFDHGITANNKPLLDHQMNVDLKNAYDIAKEKAKIKQSVTPQFLRELSNLVMRQTVRSYNSMMGSWDESNGDFRLHGVRAGIDGKSYVDFKKIDELIENLCKEINDRLKEAQTLKDIYDLSFDAHLKLVTIHPWGDGNGRTSRLLMNYIQFYGDVVPTKLYKSDKAKYISVLVDAQDNNKILPYKRFMVKQQIKTMTEEIKKFNNSKEKGFLLLSL